MKIAKHFLKQNSIISSCVLPFFHSLYQILYED